MEYKDINDYELIYMVKEDDTFYRDLIIKKYLPIVKNIANRYYSYCKLFGADYDDFVQEGLIALNKAIDSYDSNGSVKFYTYVTVCIKRAIITYTRNFNSNKNMFFNECLGSDHLEMYGEDKSRVEDTILYNFSYNELLKCKNNFHHNYSMVFELKINGFSNSEISELLDLPLSTINGRMYRIKTILQKYKKKIM